MRIVESKLAIIRLEEISLYLLEKFGYKTKEKFLNKYDQMATAIAANPDGFPKIQGTTKYRRCVLTKHNTLYYQIAEDHIAIITIFDTRQHPERLTKEL